MITNKELELIRMQAFNAEFEKIATPIIPALLGMVAKAMPKNLSSFLSKGFNKTVSWGTKSFQSGKKLTGRTGRHYIYDPLKNPNVDRFVSAKNIDPKNLIQERGKITKILREAVGLSPNKASFRPMLGTKQSPIISVSRPAPKARFEGNPFKWGGAVIKKTMGNQARNLDYVKQHGLREFLKQEFRETKHFTRGFKTKGGQKIDLQLKRSIPGRVGAVSTTGAGFGALALATNKTNEKGRKQNLPKRLVQAGAETVEWSVFQPLALAKLLAYDLPKTGFELAKGF